MRIAICDDCAEDALTLQRYLAGHERNVYSNADSLLADVEEKNIQHNSQWRRIDIDAPSRVLHRWRGVQCEPGAGETGRSSPERGKER